MQVVFRKEIINCSGSLDRECGSPGRDLSRCRILGGTPWVVPRSRLGYGSNQKLKSEAKLNLLSNMMNWSLRALETLSKGSLRFWGQRKAHLGDHVLFETLEPSEDHSWISNSRRVSDKQHDLLVRLKSFWESFEKRYQALLGVTMDNHAIGSSVMRKFYKTGYAGASSPSSSRIGCKFSSHTGACTCTHSAH